MFAKKTFAGDEFTIQRLGLQDSWQGQALLAEVLLPLMGAGIDEKTQTEDSLIYHKSSFFKDSFSHIAKIISDPRVFELATKMLRGAEVNGREINLEQYFAADIETFNEVFMWCLEVNFSSFFGSNKNGILQSIIGKTMTVMGASVEE